MSTLEVTAPMRTICGRDMADQYRLDLNRVYPDGSRDLQAYAVLDAYGWAVMTRRMRVQRTREGESRNAWVTEVVRRVGFRRADAEAALLNLVAE